MFFVSLKDINNKVMRNILTLSIFIFSLSICAQETNNFSIDNGGVVWQKVFETDLGFDDFTNKIKEMGVLGDIEIAESKMIGRLIPVEPDVSGAGFKRMSASLYIVRSLYDGFTLIEFKDGRYHVTLKNINMIQKYDDPIDKKGNTMAIEKQVAGNGEFAKHFLGKSSKILDYTFTKTFTITKSETNDDW